LSKLATLVAEVGRFMDYRRAKDELLTGIDSVVIAHADAADKKCPAVNQKVIIAVIQFLARQIHGDGSASRYAPHRGLCLEAGPILEREASADAPQKVLPCTTTDLLAHLAARSWCEVASSRRVMQPL
jgi:hypothetical protein